MMQAGRHYATRMMRSKTPAELREEFRREELLRWLNGLKGNLTDEKPFRSVNQDKPVLRLK